VIITHAIVAKMRIIRTGFFNEFLNSENLRESSLVNEEKATPNDILKGTTKLDKASENRLMPERETDRKLIIIKINPMKSNREGGSVFPTILPYNLAGILFKSGISGSNDNNKNKVGKACFGLSKPLNCLIISKITRKRHDISMKSVTKFFRSPLNDTFLEELTGNVITKEKNIAATEFRSI